MPHLACVTGRFQPVHGQHLELFEIALREADHLIVAVTNPDRGSWHQEQASAHRHLRSANPFTYYERVRLLEAALGSAALTRRTTIVPFDLTRGEYWTDYVPLSARHVVRAYSEWERHKARVLADAGYQVTVLEGDPATKMSSSEIRARIEQGRSWAELVPNAVVPVLSELLPARSSTSRESSPRYGDQR
jgi:nicotinamide-nucleotide adenylyltransferase